jgi:hypothetical protein
MQKAMQLVRDVESFGTRIAMQKSERYTTKRDEQSDAQSDTPSDLTRDAKRDETSERSNKR